MGKFTLFICLLVLSSIVKGQDNCSNAARLCANNTISSTTVGATTVPSDPALGCSNHVVNNSVWFVVTASGNGFCTVTVGQSAGPPGLEIEAYTGGCGSLVSTGVCNSGNTASISITFPVLADSTYHIMVDGFNGAQKGFTILATSSTNSIIGKPVPGFIPTTFSGCAPLSLILHNTTLISGGTNLSYEWRINGGPFLGASGNDTTIVFNTTGYQVPVDLKVGNAECGFASATQYIDIEKLTGAIVPPANICIGTPASFTGTAQYLPDPPFTTPNIVSWNWDFGDPASGGNNTANGNTVQHTFVGAGPSFTVRLIVTSADCGTDTVFTTVTAKPKPVVNAGANQTICQGQGVTLTAAATNATSPVSYLWSGAGTLSCSTCNPTVVSALAPGTNTVNIHIEDVNGCIADSSVVIRVTPKPVVSAGNDTTVCQYSTVQLNANVTAGTAPFTYSWSPSSGLTSAVIQNPVATVSSPKTYCVVVTDTIGCPSDPSCMNILLFPKPVITPSPGTLCSTNSNLTASFSVGGAAGSTYSWTLSPDYSLITSANADSSTVGLTFPTGIPGTYNFTVIVKDGITGCSDTVSTVYTVVQGLTMTLTPSAKICLGDNISLAATNALTYSWAASPAYPFTDATLATQLVSPSVTTVFTVTGMIGTCSQTLTDTITVNPKPTITVSNDSTVCPNSPVLLTATATGGTPAYTYSWTPSTGLTNPNIPNPIAGISSSGTYCVFAKDSNDCISNTKCVALTVYPNLNVLSIPASICATDTNRKATFTITGASPGSAFSWFLSANYSLITSSNSDSSAVTATFPLNIAANYSFTVIVQDAVTGCIDTITRSYTVTPGLNMAITGTNKICAGSSTALSGSGSPNYSWSALPAYSFFDATQKNQTVSPTTTTIFTLFGTNGSCNQKITYTVTVDPKPDAVASPIPSFCGCATVNLNGSLSSAGMTYSWVSTGGNTITNQSLQNTTASICSTDSFLLFVTDPVTTCSNKTFVKAIRIAKPAAVFTMAPKFICPGASTTVLLDGTGSNTTTGTTYHWTSDNGGALVADTAALITTATINTATIFYLTVKNSAGCDSTVSDTVQTYSLPTITAINPYICTSDLIKTANVIVNGASPGSTFTWDTIPSCVTPNTASASSQVFDFSSCTPDVYSFYITVTDAVAGCITQVNQSVTLVAGVTLTTTGDISICEGNTAVLSASGANSYSWSPGGETTTGISVTGLTVTGSPYQYILTGTIGSCSKNDTMFVTVNPVPVTDSIKGSVFVCANDSNVLYTVTPSTGNYTWTIANGVILSGQNNDSILVQWGTTGTGTLTVIDTNVFNCVGNLQTLNVAINPLPVTSAISGPDSVCQNDIVTYSVTNHPGSVYNWNASAGTVIGSSIVDSVVVQWNTAGVGYLTVNETSAAGCKSITVQDSISIFPIPPAPSITGNQNVCDGDTMQLYFTASDPTATFTWNVAGGTIVSGQGKDSLFVNWGVAGGGTVSVINLSQYGCPSDTGTLSVSINAHPVISGLPDSITICRNNGLPLTGVVNTGSVKWTTSGTGTFGNDTLASTIYIPGVTDSGSVVLTMLVTTTFCGSDTDSVVVTVIPSPKASLSALPAFTCAGDTAILVATGGDTYLWIHSGTTTDSIRVSPTITTTYTVIVNNSFNCPDTGAIVLNVNPLPQTDSIKGPVSVCVNDSNVLYTVTPANGNYTWTISNGSILSGIKNDSVYVKWDTAGTGILTVVDTNSFGCYGVTRVLTAAINAHPVTSSILGPDTVCENSLIIYTVTDHPGSSYNWNVQGGSIIGSTNLDTLRVLWGTNGSGYLTVNETSNVGCASDTVRDTVYIFSIPPVPLITGDTTLCAGDTMQLYTATPDSGSIFTWGVLGGTIVNGQSNDSLLINWGASGTGTVSVIDMNYHGCSSDTGFINVSLNPLPLVTVTPDSATICRNSSLQLTSVVSTGTIQWTTSGTGTFNDTSILTPIYTPGTTDSGRVVLMLIASTLICGSDTDSVIVNVIPPPVIGLTGTSTSLCLGDTTTLVATGGSIYSWSPGGATTDSLTVSPTTTTTYSVMVNNSFNCQASSSILVTVTPPGIPDGGPDLIVCRHDSVFLTGSVINAGGLIWSTLGDGNFTDVLTPATIYITGTNDSTAGVVHIVLSATGGCRNLTDTITVTFGSVPTANAGADTIITSEASTGATVSLNGTSTNSTTEHWTTTGTGIFTPNDSSLNGSYTLSNDDLSRDSIIITLTVTGPCGTAVDYFVIEFSDFTIPNVFTPYPNTPGYNDFFEIIHLPGGSHLKIWDRWGLLVYSSDNYQNDWDAHGLSANEFYYILETRGKKYHGSIRVIR